MRLKISILLVLFLAFVSYKSNTKETTLGTKLVSNDEGLLVKRSSLLISDLEQSLKIYRDILGFSASPIMDTKSDSYSYPVFKIPKEAKMRLVNLDSDSQQRVLSLKEVKEITLPKLPVPHMSAVLIKVTNLQEVMLKIEDLGLEISEYNVVEGKRLRYKEQSFIDYDGHLIALYETF